MNNHMETNVEVLLAKMSKHQQQCQSAFKVLVEKFNYCKRSALARDTADMEEALEDVRSANKMLRSSIESFLVSLSHLREYDAFADSNYCEERNTASFASEWDDDIPLFYQTAEAFHQWWLRACEYQDVNDLKCIDKGYAVLKNVEDTLELMMNRSASFSMKPYGYDAPTRVYIMEPGAVYVEGVRG